MPSQPRNISARTLAARANGAKSTGPVTLAGRARSARNRLCHGLTAHVVVLDTESQKDFLLLLDSFLDRFQPADAVEAELVHAMAAARWRIRRLYAIESTLLDNELLRRAPFIEDEFTEVDDNDRLAHAFQGLADHSHSLALLIRYEANLHRAYDRAFKQLHMLQSARTRSQNPPQPNEPKPPVSPLASVASEPTPLPAPTPAAPVFPSNEGLPPASCDNGSSPSKNVHHLYP